MVRQYRHSSPGWLPGPPNCHDRICPRIYEAFFDMYRGRLLESATKAVGPANAEDAVQEAFTMGLETGALTLITPDLIYRFFDRSLAKALQLGQMEIPSPVTYHII